MTLQRVLAAFGRTLAMALGSLVLWLASPFILLGVLILYAMPGVAFIAMLAGIVCMIVGSYSIGLAWFGVGVAAYAVSTVTWDWVHSGTYPAIRHSGDPDAIPASSLRIDFNR